MTTTMMMEVKTAALGRKDFLKFSRFREKRTNGFAHHLTLILGSVSLLKTTYARPAPKKIHHLAH